MHHIQNMRRSADFNISDYIVTYYQDGGGLGEVIAAHGEYIKQETLSRELLAQAPADGAYVETLDADGIRATIGARRVSDG